MPDENEFVFFRNFAILSRFMIGAVEFRMSYLVHNDLVSDLLLLPEQSDGLVHALAKILTLRRNNR